MPLVHFLFVALLHYFNIPYIDYNCLPVLITHLMCILNAEVCPDVEIFSVSLRSKLAFCWKVIFLLGEKISTFKYHGEIRTISGEYYISKTAKKINCTS